MVAEARISSPSIASAIWAFGLCTWTKLLGWINGSEGAFGHCLNSWNKHRHIAVIWAHPGQGTQHTFEGSNIHSGWLEGMLKADPHRVVTSLLPPRGGKCSTLPLVNTLFPVDVMLGIVTLNLSVVCREFLRARCLCWPFAATKLVSSTSRPVCSDAARLLLLL